jgi:hypothetical protein
MYWDIINTSINIPKCIFCHKTTDQMLRCNCQPEYIWICSHCARFVKDAMNKWKGLKSVDYIEDTSGIFDSKNIDSMLDHTVYDEK